MHELRVDRLDLVGGGRQIVFHPNFSVIKGSITTGKTTIVRLLRAALGRVPTHLPPETDAIRSVRALAVLGDETWMIDRPLVTTATAIVSLGRQELADETIDGEPEADDDVRDGTYVIVDAIRLPAERPTSTVSETYLAWLLRRLNLPEVSVPRARTDILSEPTPVTINDWLNYCIVRDDEIDTSVFGHRDQFVDRKRRAVFELIYGIYNQQVAELQASFRSVELRLADLDRTTEAVRGFLKDTPFSSLDEIDQRSDLASAALARLQESARDVAALAHVESASVGLRREIAAAEQTAGALDRTLSAARRNLRELVDLSGTLAVQSQRLTRAIVADEWLVDFDFLVCPRCGTSVESQRTGFDHCYLCLQVPHASGAHDSLIKEQERIASQIVETEELVALREKEIRELVAQHRAVISGLAALNEELERRVTEFVSVRSDAMATATAERARLEAEVRQLEDYRQLVIRFADLDGLRASLEQERADLADAIGRQGARTDRSEGLIKALEARFFDYLSRLHVSLSDLPLSASINRTTYLPEVTGRPFDELSSQGLTVLVNVAHALAHHTVAIDNNLPLPGLLVLDGLSNNVGHEGFDLARRDDTYTLLMEESDRYEGRLQIIALDNDVPGFATTAVVATLTPEDRLIRVSATDDPVLPDDHAERDPDG